MTLVAAVLSGFVVALAAPVLTRYLRGVTGWLLALLPAGLAVYFCALLPRAADEQPLIFAAPWVPELGVDVALRADGLGLLFAILVSGVGAFVVSYAGGYLKGHPQLGRFYGWLLTFMAAMLGVALADNLLLVFVFWELTSLSSYALIGFEHEREEARSAALQALLVTGGGGLALLAGIVLLGFAGGSLNVSALLNTRDGIIASPLYVPALCLILIGAFTKSAQFPFHFWLPNAMEAPTPVSAYLHSATMVKAGVYLLARLHPAMGGTDLWVYAIGGVGILTMLIGGYLALAETDLKRILAYSTVSALGMLTMLIGLGTTVALKAAVVMLLAHALYKGALFLVAGAVDHEAGTRDVAHLGGLRRAMPMTAVAAALAGLSMAGLPPFFGFIAKELTYEAALGHGVIVAAAAFAASLFFVFIAGVVGIAPFWGAPRHTPHHPHEAPPSLWIGPATLAGLSVLIGLWPDMVSDFLMAPAASSVIGRPIEIHLGLWHGLTPALVLSVVTLLAGAWLYSRRGAVRRRARQLSLPVGPSTLYASALDALNALARAQTAVLQSGYLRYYLLTILVVGVGLAGFTLLGRAHGPEVLVTLLRESVDLEAYFYELALAGLIVIATLSVTLSQSSLGAVVALGIVGYGVALIFLLFGAPDLAMTQFLVESLTVILFVLAFYHLPEFGRFSATRERAFDAVVALIAGGVMTVLVLVAVDIQLHPSIAPYFIETALPLAHGRNIVNAILVDFRALDTLGEITVLGIAAIGVYALLKFPRGKSE